MRRDSARKKTGPAILGGRMGGLTVTLMPAAGELPRTISASRASGPRSIQARDFRPELAIRGTLSPPVQGKPIWFFRAKKRIKVPPGRPVCAVGLLAGQCVPACLECPLMLPPPIPNRLALQPPLAPGSQGQEVVAAAAVVAEGAVCGGSFFGARSCCFWSSWRLRPAWSVGHRWAGS